MERFEFELETSWTTLHYIWPVCGFGWGLGKGVLLGGGDGNSCTRWFSEKPKKKPGRRKERRISNNGKAGNDDDDEDGDNPIAMFAIQ